jgi:selenide, water dikinase
VGIAGQVLQEVLGLRDGLCLIVPKALGTGTLFATDMRQRAKGRWITAAFGTLQSHRLGAQCLRSY